MIKLFNTLTRKIEEFQSIERGKVGMYTCGQTVYDYTHIGHLRRYVGDDILRRVLTANGFDVKHVQNVTDVGHLTSDADTGEDKLEKGAKQQGKTVWEVAKFFEDYHYKSLDQLNVLRPTIICRATEHVEDQIQLIKRLEEKGFTYKTDQAVYFDITKFPDYSLFSRQKLEEEKTGARVNVVVDKQKKNPQDFALWFFTVGHFKDHVMRWSSDWGEGFPGWHIECSAMSMKYLGETFDIHTGGIDHIPIHHTNEIAQSEGATGKPFVRYWIHHGWLLVDNAKMSKSKKNFYTIDDIKKGGFDPLALRYLFLTAHYRDNLNFTWKSLEAAQNAFNRLKDLMQSLGGSRDSLSREKSDKIETFKSKFLSELNNDLGAPGALAVLWEVVKSNIPNQDKKDLLLSFDEVLGLRLDKISNFPIRKSQGKQFPISNQVKELVEKREKMRKEGKFEEADEIRKKVESMGYSIKDTDEGPEIIEKLKFKIKN